MVIQARIFDRNDSSNPNSPMSGPLLAISAMLQPVLQMDGGGQALILCVKNCLKAVHPGQVTETAASTDYIITWNGEGWCRVCLPSAEFEVKHPTGEVSVIQVSESSHYTTETPVTRA